jgi:hypothetical protein
MVTITPLSSSSSSLINHHIIIEIADMDQGLKKGFNLTSIALSGMDTTNQYALVNVDFTLGQNATIAFNFASPPGVCCRVCCRVKKSAFKNTFILDCFGSYQT